ncbi:hypothetical protein BGZ60DRAFT_468955 [Tricladium varicosporioides]|nr:hypothetical protein BGZ60DRAFT_468955 [Hymenoscyphus varicosporioides]
MSVEQQIQQLNDARKLVLKDPSHYQQIVQGILPIIGPGARVELRRWGADFLAETFSSPTVPAREKETLAVAVLETIKLMIESEQEDNAVVKSIVQCCASIYPLIFRWIINNSYDRDSWERITAIKSRILRIWDTAVSGVRICCIKFAQRVVLVQTAGPNADPRRDDPLEVSLALVPPNHAVLLPRNLEAESSGLLDRMLSIFQESVSDAVMVDATLNSLSILIRVRPQVSGKILNVILNFNPLKLANSPMTPKLRVMVKSMEKTTRMLLMHVNKRDPQGPLAGRIQQYVERMVRSRNEIFDEANRKRGPPEPVDGLDPAKRQKLGAQILVPMPKLDIPVLKPGPHTIAELFTLKPEPGLEKFDVAVFPEDMVVQLGITILQKLDVNLLNQAVDGVRARFNSLKTAQPELLNAATAPLGIEEDEDDYEPDFFSAEDTEQILNKLDNAPPEEPKAKAPDMALKHFALPPSPPLTSEEISQISQGTVSRVFEVMQTLEEPGKKSKAGLNRLAASAYDRDAWITLITRIATRSPVDLEEGSNVIKAEANVAALSVCNTIRESLYLYILEDFRKRIDIAIAWLCEEWYNDKVQMMHNPTAVLQYEKWVLKVLDGILPYLDGRDKVLTRFLGEIPGLSLDVLSRVKGLCRDPALVQVALTSLLYLVMMRPPSREMALDAFEDIWSTYDDAKPIAAKYLTKWRPGFTDRIKGNDDEKKSNGVTAVAA